MVDFNPNAPATVGSEFLATGSQNYGLGPNLGVGVLLHSSATETIRDISRWLVPTKGGRRQTTTATVICDVYNANDVFVTDPVYSYLGPSQRDVDEFDVTHFQNADYPPLVINGNGNTNNLQAQILLNSRTDPTDTHALIYSPPDNGERKALFHGYASNQWQNFIDGSPAAAPTGRVINVTVEVIVSSLSVAGSTIDGCISLNGRQYLSDTGGIVLPPRGGEIRARFEWRWNPSNGLEWTEADLVQFTRDGGPGGGLGVNTFGVRVQVPKNTGHMMIWDVELVAVTCQEKRIVTAFATCPLSGSWYAGRTASPADYSGLDWAKVAGNDYWLSFHLGGDGGSVNAVSLDASNIDVDPSTVGGSAALDGWQHASLPYQSINAVPCIVDLMHGNSSVGPQGTTTDLIVSDACPSVVLLNAAGAASVDSMPYEATHHKVVSSTSAGIRQIIPNAAGNYGMVGITCMTTQNGGLTQQVDPLTITVRRLSDDAVLLGPVDLAVGDIPLTGKWQRVRVPVPVGPVTVPCYIELTSTDLVGWWVVEGETHADPGTFAQTAIQDATAYGGRTGFFTDDGVDDVNMDAVGWVLQQIPAAPSNPLAAVAQQFNQPSSAGVTNPATVRYASLTWSSTLTDGLFEIQRVDPQLRSTSVGYWHTIGYTNDLAFADYELPRGVPNFYRIRQQGPAGFSAWATFNAVTVPVTDCEVVLASNVAGDLALACETTTPSQWKIPEGDRVTFVQIDGRDTPFAFREPERSGDTFTLDLQLAFHDPQVLDGTVTPGRAVFDAAVGLLHNPALPYVAVCDWNGNVWYAAPQIQQLEQIESIGHYHMTVNFTTCATVPFPVKVTAT